MTKLYDGGFLFAISVVGIAIVVSLVSTYFLGDDNDVEEIAEDVIEDETGFRIDLTPKTPEFWMEK